MPKRPERRFVQPNKERGGFDVVKPSASRASAHEDTKAKAMRRGREILRNRGGGELTERDSRGRIVDSDTVPNANDPNPPRDKNR
jgi:Uncharacterized protein conserved in bacteria (DUF2188)